MKCLGIFSILILSLIAVGCSTSSEGDLASLESPNDIVKKQAIQRIGKGGSSPIGFVNRLLGETVETRAVDVMVGQLREGKESEDIQLSILKTLGDLGRRVKVPGTPLIERLRDESPRIRFQAVESLGKIKNPEAVPALLELLERESDKDPIIWALGEIGDRRAVPVLNRLLMSEDQFVRHNARRALAKIQ